MRFEMRKPLTEKQCQSIEIAALKILEKVGLEISHAETLQALEGKPGIRLDGRRVRLDPQFVLEQAKAVKGTSIYEPGLISGGYAHNFLDPETGEVRPPTLGDLVKSVRQANALGHLVCGPVVPLDVPGPRQEIVMERVTDENSQYSYGGGQITTAVTAEAALEMREVVHRPFEMEIWITSPLCLDPGGLDVLWKLRHRRPNVHIANMPVRGMSAPISLAGILAQSVAECLGAAAILRALDLAGSVAYRTDAFWSYNLDMRTANVLDCGPDYLRLFSLSTQLAARYGIDAPMGKTMLTSAKQPDAQALAEKAAGGMVAMLAGAECFACGGLISVAEIFSPVQMVLDGELLSWLRAYMKPLDFSEADFLLDEIEAVGPGGSFLAEESTARRMREVFWSPKIFTTNAFPAWQAEGSVSIIEKARDVLNSLKLPDEPIVSEYQRRELSEIERKFSVRL